MGMMNSLQLARRASLACVLLLPPHSTPARASNLNLPAETPAVLDKIYSFDLQGAVEAAQHMEQEHPNHPLGYLLETEALWWRIWCTSADFKYGMSDARRRPSLNRTGIISNWRPRPCRWRKRGTSRGNLRKCSVMPAWPKPPRRAFTDYAAKIATPRAPECVAASISCAPRVSKWISPMPTWVWVFITITWTR